ncbi:ankyrin repeat-containing protein NPR4-like [Chenopodium quinoa]|uniref:PGG domain-containing protein n=1 Tax=Chenopodium quinoa TaxID=63459 RepID=A0A803MVG5_CHEQI|nr:ankyrin repeat-containing protein NPR4-like [Chenopodium quinoa]
MTTPMDVYLETAAREGNEGYLNDIHLQSNGEENGEAAPDESYFLGQTSDGENILHLAASRGHYGFIVKALLKIPAAVLLIYRSNSQGENPLHIAARLGHLEVVQALVNSYKSHLQNVKDKKVRSTMLSLMVVEEGTSPDPWVVQDSSGNTPLHEALRNGYEEVAMYLLDVEPRLANYVNNAAEGTPYLSAAYGHEQVLEKILTSDVTYSLSAPAGLTPLHAAIHNCTEDVVRLFLAKHPELAKKADRRRQNALYYAAVADKEGHVEAILKTEKSCAYLRDEKGLSPLLIAASLGQLKAARAILLHCPQSITICDPNGKTVLHLMKLGSYQEGTEMLSIPALKRLINIPDIEGNTPLHLAARNSDHIMAKVILDTDKTGINLRNKEGYTPWDLIKLQELSENMAEIGYQLVMHLDDKQTPSQPQVINQTTLCPENANERMQKKFSTLGIIAVILAAITFAAGFSIPGGFDQRGYAVLTRDTVFKVFMLSNTTAMCGYTFVLFSTLWAMMLAQRDDQPRFLLPFSIHILQLSFYATLIAFVSSAYALTSARSLWLAIVLVCLPPCAVLLTISKSVVFRLARFFSRLRIY